MFLGSATLEHICFFCEMGFYLSTFELIPSEKTNICCCELKHFRLFPVNPRPSPRCCRLRGNRLWFCAETPCQARQPTTPGLPHKLARLPQQACHRTTSAFEVRLATPPHQACPAMYHTGKHQVRPGKGKLFTSLKVLPIQSPAKARQHLLPCHSMFFHLP